MKTGSVEGRRLGGFTVERELGSGGMGMVVLARQESLDRAAVLKRIHPMLETSPELEARLEREAVTAARLHHPNVVGVYDRFHHRGHQYIATEFVDGLDLSLVLKAEGRLPWRVAATVALECARGLEAIHDEGTLHRDVKPQNILIGRHGEVKITDFGLALDPGASELTCPGIAIGTPPYMPPEQLRGERVDARADLFALGCVLYEMLTNETPYRSPSDEEGGTLLVRVESGRYPRIRKRCRDAPRSLVRLVRSCLRPRASRRIASAAEIRRRLERLLGRPSTLDCRGALAAFLWERHVFEPRASETVVRVVRTGGDAIPHGARVGFASAALVASFFCLALALRNPAQVVDWTDSVTREITRQSMIPVRRALNQSASGFASPSARAGHGPASP